MTERKAVPLIEMKRVRRVRTAAGVQHYGQPIGSVIVADALPEAVGRLADLHPSPKPLRAARASQRRSREVSEDGRLASATPKRGAPKLSRVESDYEGWNKWVIGRRSFYIGKEDDGTWVATDADDNVLVEGTTAGGVKIALEKHLGIHKEVKQSSKTAHLKVATPEEIKGFKDIYGKPIPPGLHEIRITTDPKHHLIASGINSSGGTTFIYASWFEEGTAAAKWARVREFAQDAKKLDRGLAKEALTDDTAAAVLLMRRTGIRVGSSDEQVGSVQAFGATTLQGRHFRINEKSVTLDFVGKEGVKQHFVIKDPDIIAMFKAREDRQRTTRVFDTSDKKTIAFIREKTGKDGYKNHDLRTLLANEMAANLIQKWERRPPKTKTEYRRMRKEIGTAVAAQLGNNATQALSSYINPAIFAPYIEEGWV